MPQKQAAGVRGTLLRRDSKLNSALITSVARHGLGPFLQSTRTLVALVDAHGRLVADNPAFELLLQSDPSAVSFLDLIAPVQREPVEQLLESARRAKKPIQGQIDFGTTGHSIGCDCLLVPAGRGATLLFAEPTHAAFDLLKANDRLAEELTAARSALDEKTAEFLAVVAHADELAHTDSLTLLPNRRSIIADVQRQVTYAERYGTPLAISMLDLDGFKAVNDSSGHLSGDKILGIVARDLRDRIRQPDEIGRYGGDEFLVVLPNSTAAAASEQASRLCQHVRSTRIPLGETSIQLTLSAGIAQFRQGADDWSSVLERADRALYEAKHLGGDRWLLLES
ncbi:MAG: sensor domain-containing diguanylate cyclase [Chloroflexota bacterium]